MDEEGPHWSKLQKPRIWISKEKEEPLGEPAGSLTSSAKITFSTSLGESNVKDVLLSCPVIFPGNLNKKHDLDFIWQLNAHFLGMLRESAPFVQFYFAFWDEFSATLSSPTHTPYPGTVLAH